VARAIGNGLDQLMGPQAAGTAERLREMSAWLDARPDDEVDRRSWLHHCPVRYPSVALDLVDSARTGTVPDTWAYAEEVNKANSTITL
jgi:hypothetical protein